MKIGYPPRQSYSKSFVESSRPSPTLNQLEMEPHSCTTYQPTLLLREDLRHSRNIELIVSKGMEIHELSYARPCKRGRVEGAHGLGWAVGAQTAWNAKEEDSSNKSSDGSLWIGIPRWRWIAKALVFVFERRKW